MTRSTLLRLGVVAAVCILLILGPDESQGRVMLERYGQRLRGFSRGHLGYAGLNEVNQQPLPADLFSPDPTWSRPDVPERQTLDDGTRYRTIDSLVREFLGQRTAPTDLLSLLSFDPLLSSIADVQFVFGDGNPLMLHEQTDPSDTFPCKFGRRIHIEDLIAKRSSTISADERFERHSFKIFQDIDGFFTVTEHRAVPISSEPSSSGERAAKAEGNDGTYGVPLSSMFSGFVDSLQAQLIGEPEPTAQSSVHRFDLPIELVHPWTKDLAGEDVRLPASVSELGVQRTKLTVLNFNIWNYNLPWIERRDMIVQLVQDLQPDIVAMQEVRYDFLKQYQTRRRNFVPTSFDAKEGRFQVEQLCGALPDYQFVYDIAMTYLEFEQGKFRTDEGLAILSRHPITNHTALRLTRDLGDPGDEHHRLLQSVVVDVPGVGPFNIFNTHLTLSNDARVRSADEIWQFTSSRPEHVPQLLVGDFNSEPDDHLVTYLTNGPGNFQDGWSKLYPDEPGFTFESWEPRKRIDFALLRNFEHTPLRLNDIRIVGTEPIKGGGKKGTDLFASDHFGLFIEFEWQSTN